MQMKKIIVISGGFDPLHSGHIEYLRSARAIGDELVVGINSDAWLVRKKGKAFLPFEERMAILSECRSVDHIAEFNDDDGSAKNLIRTTLELFPDAEIVFANGGDRTSENIPEMDIQDPRLSFQFGVGGEDKKNSSSWILKKWESQE
jgi:D-beta-D-heptose 7-phosphate kinase/D-beta-D-heptose 1-phosphate adenosyltransferase